jgi:hypothetical protein
MRASRARCRKKGSNIFLRTHHPPSFIKNLQFVMLTAMIAALLAAPLVQGHGAMVHPRSRNSIDFPEVKNDPSKGE